MNIIVKQREYIDQLYWLIRDSIEEEYEKAVCQFSYDHGYEDGSFSTGSQLSYFQNGELITSNALRYPDRRILRHIIPQLHALMKEHTGGDWHAFTLTINEDGSVTTKFEYKDGAEKQ